MSISAPCRCAWAKAGPLAYYHDAEWGRPLKDEGRLFELLLLEGCQAGLSWETVLKKRENYRKAFFGFDVERIAAFGDADKARLLADAGIIRNRAKIDAMIGNARATLALYERGTDLSTLLWDFVGGVPLQPNLTAAAGWPATTPLSGKISRELTALGYRFVGPTIIYALMQSAGLTNDHSVECFLHAELSLPPA